MALVEPHKKGGRYTIKETEERRIQVHHLHFEENKSAVKISKLLDVSRNTINKDIIYWHSQLAHEFKAQSLTSKMTKQIQRMEMHQDRLSEFLEEPGDEKFKIAKLISENNNKLIQFYSKMIISGKTTLEPTVKIDDIDEDLIKELILDLVFQKGEEAYSQSEMRFHFIQETKCNIEYAENILKRMFSDGLGLCDEVDTSIGYLDSYSQNNPTTYNLVKFANLRGYISKDKVFEIQGKLTKIKRDVSNRNRVEKKLNESYGNRSQWPIDILEKFESDDLGELMYLL